MLLTPMSSSTASVFLLALCLTPYQCDNHAGNKAAGAEVAKIQALQLDEGANSRTVQLRAGQQLEIRLAENRTTGFQWTLVSDGTPACKPVSNSYEAPKGPPGAGGTARWLFQAATAGAGTIELAYRRPWETEKPPIRTFRVQISVSN